MAQSGSRTGDSVLMRVALGVIAVFVAWILLSWVLGALVALVRIALLLGLLAVVAWFVLIGPPGGSDSD